DLADPTLIRVGARRNGDRISETVADNPAEPAVQDLPAPTAEFPEGERNPADLKAPALAGRNVCGIHRSRDLVTPGGRPGPPAPVCGQAGRCRWRLWPRRFGRPHARAPPFRRR